MFNFYVRDFPDCAELTVSYADDYTIFESDVDLVAIDERLNCDLRRIEEWARRKELSISAEKSSVTFFSTDSHQHSHHPQVFIGGSLLPLNKTPKILGITLDLQLTFGPHAKMVMEKTAPRMNVIKAVSGTDWGGAREDLLLPSRRSWPPSSTTGPQSIRPT